MRNHVAYFGIAKHGHFINVLECVLRIRHGKAEIEIKAFQQFFAKIVTFDHFEIVNWLFAHTKLNAFYSKEDNKLKFFKALKKSSKLLLCSNCFGAQKI